ncbi:hypothetical protein JXJ21_14370 [candidate division KSB1 bacterium]|nr:hypothetical protein [candidate division KSB1 bacterium]
MKRQNAILTNDVLMPRSKCAPCEQNGFHFKNAEAEWFRLGATGFWFTVAALALILTFPVYSSEKPLPPRIAFDKLTYDAGLVKRGSTVYGNFYATNKGDSALIIESVRPT